MGVNGSAINYGLSNLQAPASGTTHAVKVNISLSNETFTFPLNSLAQVIGDFTAQAMTVDNTNGSDVVTVAETVYGWQRTINAGVAQTFQFPAIPNPVFTFTTAGSVSDMIVSLYDWPAFPDAWTNNGNAGLSTVVTIAGQPISVQVVALSSPWGAAAVPYSAGNAFAVVTGGTAVTVFGGSAVGNYALIKNPDDATEALYIDFVNTAQVAEPGTHGTCIALQPGASYVFRDYVPTVAVTANAATNGHAFVALIC